MDEEQFRRLAEVARAGQGSRPAAPAGAEVQAMVRALARHSRPGERAEEKLLDLGLVDERELAIELAAGSGRVYTGLRGFVPDPAHFLYVPLEVATRERVCPLLLVGDSLKLTCAFLDPDLRSVTSRFPHLELDLVVSPRSEILTALRLVAAAL